MACKRLVLRTTTILIILGTIGRGFCAQSIESSVSVPLSTSSELQITGEESRSLFKKPKRLRTGQFNVDVPVHNPSFTYNRISDYWPYKKIYSTNLFSVIDFGFWLVKAAKKALWYLYDFSFLGLKIAYQIFDILEMRKSYDKLSHGNSGAGHGWGDKDFDDY